jgi:phosphatidylinositol alpha-1,6-mannosyltransferase
MRSIKLKLIVISIEFPPGPGGLGTLAYQISNHLVKLDWQVAVASPQSFATNQDIELFNAQQPFEILSLNYKGPSVFEGTNRLIKILQLNRSFNPNVLIAIGWQSVWLGYLISLITDIPYIALGVGSEFQISSRIKRKLIRWSYQHADMVIFISQYTRNLAKDHGIHPRKEIIISLGADEDIFKPNLPTEYLHRQLNLSDSKVILTVGQVSERKGQDIVIKALPDILVDFPNTIYLIVGLPTNQTRLEQLADDLGVADHVIFTGKVPKNDLASIYNRADIFVLVSRSIKGGEVEGFGIAVVEAALCGIPAIVSNESGLVEAVVPDVTALVVDQDHPEMTSVAIKQLLANDQIRQEMGLAARRYALNQATWRQRVLIFDHHLRTFLENK